MAVFLEEFCKNLLANVGQFHRMLLLDLGGPMTLEAAQGGLPHGNAVQVNETIEQASHFELKNNLGRFLTIGPWASHCISSGLIIGP